LGCVREKKKNKKKKKKKKWKKIGGTNRMRENVEGNSRRHQTEGEGRTTAKFTNKAVGHF